MDNTFNGSRITEKRKSLGFSQEQLANKLGVSQKSISKYECGERRPSYEVLLAMSSIFNVSIDYLLGNTNFETNKNTNADIFNSTINDLSSEEKLLLNIYRTHDKDYKDIVWGELKKCEKLQKLEHKQQKITKKEA